MSQESKIQGLSLSHSASSTQPEGVLLHPQFSEGPVNGPQKQTTHKQSLREQAWAESNSMLHNPIENIKRLLASTINFFKLKK
jgi:hypothetical protein